MARMLFPPTTSCGFLLVTAEDLGVARSEVT